MTKKRKSYRPAETSASRQGQYTNGLGFRPTGSRRVAADKLARYHRKVPDPFASGAKPHAQPVFRQFDCYRFVVTYDASGDCVVHVDRWMRRPWGYKRLRVMPAKADETLADKAARAYISRHRKRVGDMRVTSISYE